ncbi:MAG: hypothetical protein HKN87_13155 [Saprospiraceae bacterium]|nr:hypothetical protein [Saprospiraceae bacterium]
MFAGGSPFDPVTVKGVTRCPWQGNNVYVFPGIGPGMLYSQSTQVTDRMFLEAARIVSESVTEEQLARGMVYPSFGRIRRSVHILPKQ